MIPIVKHRRIFYTISGILFVASVLTLFFWGLRLGIDFRGGSLLQIDFNASRPSNNEIVQKLNGLNLGDINVQPTGANGVILRFRDIDEETHQKILTSLGGPQALTEKSFETIGPVIGQELKTRAIYAIGLVLIMIVVYIAWAFRKVSKPVSSWRYGVATIIALLHDVVIPTGFFAALGYFFGVEIDLLFVTAILTVLGFSVHDTIVVFDRIRENLRKGVAKNFEDTVEISVNQTLARSINTSLVVLFTMLAVYFFGGTTTHYFSLVLIIGLFCGTYSSIFIASTLLVSWEKYRQKRILKKKL